MTKRVGGAGVGLDHRARLRAELQAPRRDRGVDADDRAVLAEPDQVEREAHREGVNRAAARDVQREALGQHVELREALHARGARVRLGDAQPVREVAGGQAVEPRAGLSRCRTRSRHRRLPPPPPPPASAAAGGRRGRVRGSGGGRRAARRRRGLGAAAGGGPAALGGGATACGACLARGGLDLADRAGLLADHGRALVDVGLLELGRLRALGGGRRADGSRGGRGGRLGGHGRGRGGLLGRLRAALVLHRAREEADADHDRADAGRRVDRDEHERAELPARIALAARGRGGGRSGRGDRLPVPLVGRLGSGGRGLRIPVPVGSPGGLGRGRSVVGRLGGGGRGDVGGGGRVGGLGEAVLGGRLDLGLGGWRLGLRGRLVELGPVVPQRLLDGSGGGAVAGRRLVGRHCAVPLPFVDGASYSTGGGGSATAVSPPQPRSSSQSRSASVV